MSPVDSKVCLNCYRPFSNRSKWIKNFDKVKYCSQKCRRGRGRHTLIVEELILKKLYGTSINTTISLSDLELDSSIETFDLHSALRKLAYEGHIKIIDKKWSFNICQSTLFCP